MNTKDKLSWFRKASTMDELIDRIGNGDAEALSVFQDMMMETGNAEMAELNPAIIILFERVYRNKDKEALETLKNLLSAQGENPDVLGMTWMPMYSTLRDREEWHFDTLAQRTSNQALIRWIYENGAGMHKSTIAMNPNIPMDIMEVLAYSDEPVYRLRIIRNPSTPPEVLDQMLTNETRDYLVDELVQRMGLA